MLLLLLVILACCSCCCAFLPAYRASFTYTPIVLSERACSIWHTASAFINKFALKPMSSGSMLKRRCFFSSKYNNADDNNVSLYTIQIKRRLTYQRNAVLFLLRCSRCISNTFSCSGVEGNRTLRGAYDFNRICFSYHNVICD